MKKLLGIVVLSLLLTGNAHSILYKDYKKRIETHPIEIDAFLTGLLRGILLYDGFLKASDRYKNPLFCTPRYLLNIDEAKKIISDTANSKSYISEPLDVDVTFILTTGLRKKYPC